MTAATSNTSTLDSAMPALDRALDPAVAEPALKRALGESQPRWSGAVLSRIRLLRHKPGRRALVEYELSSNGSSGAETLTLLGKIRAEKAVSDALATELKAAVTEFKQSYR